MQTPQPIPEFKAVFNPFTKELAVLYGNAVSTYTFEDIEEWTKVSFNGDEEHPNYLHIQLDYDECLQLLFYPRVDNDESLHEELGTYFHSIEMDKIPEQIKLVYHQQEYEDELEKLLSKAERQVEIPQGL